METKQLQAHNFWHVLFEAERLSVDQMNKGIHIQLLKTGDIVKFETLRGNDGFAFRVIFKVVYPKQGGVRIVEVARFLGGLKLEVKSESLDQGVLGIFVVRGNKRDKEMPELGWMGLGMDIYLTGDIVFRSIRNISINESFLIFPPSSETIH